jgi:DNA-binding CsgD family transcriptional regulator
MRSRTANGHATALLADGCRGARTPLLDLGGPSAILTRREREIALLATSLPSKRIATRLGLSVHTVNNTLARAYMKLGIRNRRELVALLGRGPEK